MSKVGKRSRCHMHEVSSQVPKLRNVAPETGEGGPDRCCQPVESYGQEAEEFAQNGEVMGDVEMELRQPGAVGPNMTLSERSAGIVETLDVVHAVVYRGMHGFVGLTALIFAIVPAWFPCTIASQNAEREDSEGGFCHVKLFASSPVASGSAVLEKDVLGSPFIKSEKAVDLVAHPGESNFVHFRRVGHEPIHELWEPLRSQGLSLGASAADGVMKTREPALFEVRAIGIAKESLGQIPQCWWE